MHHFFYCEYEWFDNILSGDDQQDNYLPFVVTVQVASRSVTLLKLIGSRVAM